MDNIDERYVRKRWQLVDSAALRRKSGAVAAVEYLYGSPFPSIPLLKVSW
jgi:hypothetical protein